MREMISIGVGNFGIQTTDNLIKGIAEEHKLNEDSEESKQIIENSYPDIFFDEYQNG